MFDQTFYTIRYPKYWMIEDKPKSGYDRNNLFFHIEKDDYFGTLATVLSLINEKINNEKLYDKTHEWEVKTLRKETDNLIYLQKNYKIIPKNNL